MIFKYSLWPQFPAPKHETSELPPQSLACFLEMIPSAWFRQHELGQDILHQSKPSHSDPFAKELKQPENFEFGHSQHWGMNDSKGKQSLWNANDTHLWTRIPIWVEISLTTCYRNLDQLNLRASLLGFITSHWTKTTQVRWTLKQLI